MKVEHASHCTYRIRYHMVCVVKYRKKMLLEKTRIEFLKTIMQGLALRYYFQFDAIGIDEDHFHVVVGAAPRYAPSEVMGIIKSWSAHLIFKKYPYIKEELWGDWELHFLVLYKKCRKTNKWVPKEKRWRTPAERAKIKLEVRERFQLLKLIKQVYAED